VSGLKLSADLADRYRVFKNSKEFSEDIVDSKTTYWQQHANLISTNIDKTIVTVRGVSGVYIPPAPGTGVSSKTGLRHLGRLGRALRHPKTVFQYLAQRLFIYCHRGPLFSSYNQAFDAVMQGKEVAALSWSPYRTDHSTLAQIDGVFDDSRSLSDHYRHWSGHSLSWNVIAQYYLCNILRGRARPQEFETILEIGAGNGNMTSVCLHEFPGSRVIIVDLPETLSVSIPFLGSLFPDCRLRLPHEFGNDGWVDDFDIAFLTVGQIDLIPDDVVDLSINVASFQEMRHAQIETYFDLIQRTTRQNGWFLCVNRVEKIPVGSDSRSDTFAEPPNRFSEYPWRSTNEVLVHEVHQMMRLVQMDNLMLRLEEIRK
jgi:putative sugar O-methyltransferase